MMPPMRSARGVRPFARDSVRKTPRAFVSTDETVPELVTCAPRAMRLSEAGCARLLLSTLTQPGVKPWEGRAACVGCAIGRERAGLPPMAAPPAPVGASWCFRCQRTCERVIHRRLCVSCFNREREAVRTDLAERIRRKPGVRALKARLARRQLVVVTSGEPRILVGPLTRDMREAIALAAAAAASGFLGRPRPVWMTGDAA